MKYFIIAGEASGDLHAGNLVKALKQEDDQAQFRGLGGDLMQEQGVELVQHYRDMAYMGFIDVALHLRTILRIKRRAQEEILAFAPDVVILVDYPSFNLRVAEFVKKEMPGTKVYYYIAPKVWAWKSWRVKSLRKYVDRVFSILPFEIEWFGQRGCEVSYIGNPCVDAVESRAHKGEDFATFSERVGLDSAKLVLALLPGSRVGELKSNLPTMLEAASKFTEYQMVVAAAPSIEDALYDELCKGYEVKRVLGETYQLLQQARAAVVTSGTATLETALMRTPQVVVYYVGGGKVVHWLLTKLIKVKDVSLVNLIARKKVVKELLCHFMTAENVEAELHNILPDTPIRQQMLADYDALIELLGHEPVSQRAAKEMVMRLREKPESLL